MSVEKFKYVDQIGLTLPLLVLGVRVKDWEFKDEENARDYKFAKTRTWHRIVHQTAGLACHQKHLTGTIITPKTGEVAMGLSGIATEWYDSNVGIGGASLENILKYRESLLKIGLDCNYSYPDFEEGFYPIDPEYARQISAEPLPSNLDDLIEWDSGLSRAIGSINRWGLWVLGPNSD